MRRIVGATTITERAWLRWYAKSAYTGAGQIVDLGCWLGSTTIPLAEGVARNRRGRPLAGRVYAYDRFRWEEWMDDFVAGTRLAGSFKPGDSFRSAFMRQLGTRSEAVSVIEADLMDEEWNGGDIELLVIDAMKTADLADSIARNFLPHVQPGGRILEQDFAHRFTPWIHLLHFRLRDAIQFDYAVPDSQSVVFRVRERMRKDYIEAALPSGQAEPDELDAAFRYSLEICDPATRPSVMAAKVTHYLQDGDRSAASAVIAEAEALGIPVEGDLDEVARLVA